MVRRWALLWDLATLIVTAEMQELTVTAVTGLGTSMVLTAVDVILTVTFVLSSSTIITIDG